MIAQEVNQSHLGLDPSESFANAIMGTDAKRHKRVWYNIVFVRWRKAFGVEMIRIWKELQQLDRNTINLIPFLSDS